MIFGLKGSHRGGRSPSWLGGGSTPTAFLQALLTPEDAVLSDELNHASIIDGIRLCKAHKYRYRHLDMADLEAKLQEAQVGRGPGDPGTKIGLILSRPLVKEGMLEEECSALTDKQPESLKQPTFKPKSLRSRALFHGAMLP